MSGRGLRWVGRAALAMFLAGLVAFVVEGANRPADPYVSPTQTLPAAGPGG